MQTNLIKILIYMSKTPEDQGLEKLDKNLQFIINNFLKNSKNLVQKGPFFHTRTG